MVENFQIMSAGHFRGSVRLIVRYHLKQGFFFIPHPKEKRPKIVPLIKDDLDILRKLPAGMPDLYFFRHSAGVMAADLVSDSEINRFINGGKRLVAILALKAWIYTAEQDTHQPLDFENMQRRNK